METELETQSKIIENVLDAKSPEEAATKVLASEHDELSKRLDELQVELDMQKLTLESKADSYHEHGEYALKSDVIAPIEKEAAKVEEEVKEEVMPEAEEDKDEHTEVDRPRSSKRKRKHPSFWF